MTEMSIDKAKQVIRHVHNEHVRWGKMYNPAKDGTYTVREIVQASGKLLEMVAEDVEDGNTKQLKEDLTKANRQLAACKARYARVKRQLDSAKEQSSAD